MRRLVSSEAALAADRAAEQKFGYPPLLLMEEAGIRLQDAVEQLPNTAHVVYLAGPGNNGGDAWVMARQAFLRGRTASVVFLPPRSESCRRQAEWGALVKLPSAAWPSPAAEAILASASLWVDGLWGAGLRGALRPSESAVVSALEALRRRMPVAVAAIDVPSGVREGRAPEEPVLQADWTLSPGPLKEFCLHPQNRAACGILREVRVAFPEPAEFSTQLLEESDLAAIVPPIGAHDHKGRRGHVALLGGAPGMTGALVLSARSAASAGAGLVSLGMDEELIALVAPQVPAFQVRAAAAMADLSDRYDAWVVGPGWGHGAGRIEILRALWATGLPLVLDADGLAAWVDLGRPPRAAATVLTPHPGEFDRLGAGPADVESASALARDRGVTVVLKGSATWILAEDGRRAVWDGAEPALATGGSGDCLAGVIGAFLAVGLAGFEAALAAVALHGTAGRQLARTAGWFTADLLPEALARTAAACRTAARPL